MPVKKKQAFLNLSEIFFNNTIQNCYIWIQSCMVTRKTCQVGGLVIFIIQKIL